MFFFIEQNKQSIVFLAVKILNMFKQLTQQQQFSSDLMQFLAVWSKLTKKARKQYLYQPNIIIQLFSCIISDIQFDSFILPVEDVIEKLTHTLNTSISFHQMLIGQIHEVSKQNQVVFILQGNIKLLDQNNSEKTFKKFQRIDTNLQKERQINISRISQKILNKIQAISPRNSKIITQQDLLQKNIKFDAAYLVYDQKQIDYIKQDIIKADRILKIDFLVKYLFGGYNPIFSHKLIKVQKFQAKSDFSIKIPIEKVSLLYSGQVRLKKLSEELVYETELLSGALLTESLLEQINVKENIRPKVAKTQILCTSDCIVLSLDVQQFKKIIKNQIAIKSSIRAKRRDIQNNRLRLMKSNKLARELIKQTQQTKPTLSYPIKMRNKKSKIFRHKTNKLYDIQSFMSMDFYKKMIQNKETVVFRKDQCELKNIIDAQYQISKNPIKNQQHAQKDKFQEDVSLKGFFEVGNRIKTQKLSTSIFRKQTPSLSRKPEVYSAPKRNQSRNASVLRAIIPQSAKRSHQLYKQYSQFQNRVRNSENNAITMINTPNINEKTQNKDGVCINSLSFDPQERFSVQNGQQFATVKHSKHYSSRKQKAETFSSSKETSKTNASSQYMFVMVNTKNIINTLISESNTPKHISPFITGKYIPPRSAPLKKKNRIQINHILVR